MASKKTVLTLALGSAIAATLAAAPASAANNPFAAESLGKGYMVAEADKAKEGKCGGKAKEGKCGGKKDAKAKEGKCGGDKKAAEGKCGGKAKEGKCGEGKCGGKK